MRKLTPPWETLSELIAAENSVESAKFIDTLSPSETARAGSRLTEEEQVRLFNLLSPEDAADLIEDIPDNLPACPRCHVESAFFKISSKTSLSSSFLNDHFWLTLIRPFTPSTR